MSDINNIATTIIKEVENLIGKITIENIQREESSLNDIKLNYINLPEQTSSPVGQLPRLSLSTQTSPPDTPRAVAAVGGEGTLTAQVILAANEFDIDINFIKVEAIIPTIKQAAIIAQKVLSSEEEVSEDLTNALKQALNDLLTKLRNLATLLKNKYIFQNEINKYILVEYTSSKPIDENSYYLKFKHENTKYKFTYDISKKTYTLGSVETVIAETDNKYTIDGNKVTLVLPVN